MALTRQQYNRIMQIYQERRLRASREQEARVAALTEQLPELGMLSEKLSQTAVERAKALVLKDEELAKGLQKEMQLLNEKKEQLLVRSGYAKDYLEMHYACPHCKDTGYVERQKCGCLKKLESELIYAASGLPKLLSDENFETFDFDLFDNREILPRLNMTARMHVMKHIYPAAKQFVESFAEEPGQNMFITGPTGAGKTFLSNCIAKAIIDQNFSVVYFGAVELFELFSKNTFDSAEDEELKGKLEAVFACDLLVIDDLGTEMHSSFHNSELFKLIEKRLMRGTGRGKSTIISSNLSLNDISAVYGERISSRIIGNYIMIPFYGTDLRLKGGQ